MKHFGILSFRKKRFTLLELLITIAVISILASLLLPALNAARDKAKSIQCMSQLKTMGTYEAFYLNDYDGIPAPPFGTDAGRPGYYQWGYHWDYVFARNYASNNESLRHTNKKFKIFWCPSDPSSYPRKHSTYEVNPPRSYSFLMGWGRCQAMDGSSVYMKSSMVKQPSGSIFLTEHAYTGTTKYGDSVVGYNFTTGETGLWGVGGVGMHHNNQTRAGVLLFDGHVTTARFHKWNTSLVWGSTGTSFSWFTIDNFANRYSLLVNHTY